MKTGNHLLFVAMILLLAVACAGTQSAKKNSPLGEWEYTIKGTPQGDFAGTMVITRSDKGYTGKLLSDQGEIPFLSTTYTREANKIEAEFDYTGMPVSLTGVIAGTSITGTVKTSGYEFPLTANKKNP